MVVEFRLLRDQPASLLLLLRQFLAIDSGKGKEKKSFILSKYYTKSGIYYKEWDLSITHLQVEEKAIVKVMVKLAWPRSASPVIWHTPGIEP